MGNGWTTVGEEVILLEREASSLAKETGKEDEQGRLCGGRGARMLKGKSYGISMEFILKNK